MDNTRGITFLIAGNGLELHTPSNRRKNVVARRNGLGMVKEMKIVRPAAKHLNIVEMMRYDVCPTSRCRDSHGKEKDVTL